MRYSQHCVLAAAAGLSMASSAHAILFSDIQTWVGTGAKQAALVIDFSDGAPAQSLIWGYRWDGAATGEEMYNAVLAADPFLYTSVKIYSFGTAINGIGYDLDKDGVFGVAPSLAFDAGGYAVAEPVDGRLPTDPGDEWIESFSSAYWSYWVSPATPSPLWSSSNEGISDRVLADGSWDGLSFAAGFNAVAPAEPAPATVPEPAGAVAAGLPVLALLLRRRRLDAHLPRKTVSTAVQVLTAIIVTSAAAASASAATSATIVPGTLVQGATQPSLTGGPYAVETNSLGDWVLDTGSFGGTVFPVSLTNANFNGNAFGGTPNTLVTFGNGGGVTLKLDAPLRPVDGQKELGLFTAQMLLAGSGALFNGNMEAAVLVSADNVSYFTLGGAPVASPATFTAGSSKLNAPTVAYDFRTGAQAADYGSPGTTPAALAALAIARYERPMPDDTLFNGSGTSAERAAFMADTTESVYDAIFGPTGGGNWFDLSQSGLDSVNYIRLNAVNTGGGIRLDAVFANPAAVPEPSGAAAALLAGGVMGVWRRRR